MEYMEKAIFEGEYGVPYTTQSDLCYSVIANGRFQEFVDDEDENHSHVRLCMRKMS